MAEQNNWINDLEIENASIKWVWSHFDGRKDTFNDEGDHNFQIILTPEMAAIARDEGWTIKEQAPYEEGDDPEFLLKAHISYRFEAPKVYFIKGERKYRVTDPSELADIKRSTVEQLDVILQPSRWVQQGRTGVTAYVKEMYVKIKESRFEARYADFEEV